MYMQKNANATLSGHFQNFKAVYCDKCKQPDGEESPFDPSVLALKILNRCFTFQIEAIIMNQTEDLLDQIGKDNHREVSVREFAAEIDYTRSVWERLQSELVAAKQKEYQTDINFELLYQLTRAMANILILTQDQLALIKSLHNPTQSEDFQLAPSLI